jgi:hypothetical protein
MESNTWYATRVLNSSAVIALALGGCATGGGDRWFSAPSREFTIRNSTYQVRYISEGSAIDMQVKRIAPIIVTLPDPLIEHRQAQEAATQLAQQKCRSANLVVESAIEAQPNGLPAQFRLSCR